MSKKNKKQDVEVEVKKKKKSKAVEVEGTESTEQTSADETLRATGEENSGESEVNEEELAFAATPEDSDAASGAANDEATGPAIPGDLVTDLNEIESAVLAIVFASPVALSVKKIKNLLTHGGYDSSQLELVLESLSQNFSERGIQLVKVAGGYQLRSNPKYATVVQKLVEEKPQRLGKSALEVLSIVAYKQPITRADVDHVRGTDSGHLLKNLLEKNLVRTEGHKETAGRPLLYGTTPYFLEVFTLGSLDDLPALEDFERELKDADSDSDPDSLLLNADPAFFDRPSGLDAEADRGTYDARTDDDDEKADFGVADRAQEEVEQDLARLPEETA